MAKVDAIATLTIKVSKDDLILFTDVLYDDMADNAINGLDAHASNEDTHGLTARFAAVNSDIDDLWIEVATKVDIADIDLSTKANKSGDTFTGTVIIDGPAEHLVLTSPTTARRSIYGSVGGLKRWEIDVANNDEESGENFGSNFSIGSYNDDGTFNTIALEISRKYNYVSVKDIIVGGSITVEDLLDMRIQTAEPTTELKFGTLWIRPIPV
jgi:hypothetical protein